MYVMCVWGCIFVTSRRSLSHMVLQLGTLTVKALATPCHTTGHVCYYVCGEDAKSKAVFTGGCGVLGEGKGRGSPQ